MAKSNACANHLNAQPREKSSLARRTIPNPLEPAVSFPNNLENARVNTVIIGATGGIGSALARVVPHPLILTARNRSALRELAREVGAYDVPVDVTRELEVAALAQEIQARGGTRLVVYAVGDIVPGTLTQLSRDALERVWAANVLGAQLVLKHLEPTLTPDARLYFLGARSELVEFRGFSAYATAKAALETLCRVAQLELKRSVTVVKPSAVNTAFWERLESPVPRNAIAPEQVATAILESLTRDPVAELRVG
jgi:NAD(P)-dependent dehydrogenase (short-subunit alcohol dehydrogenase family)